MAESDKKQAASVYGDFNVHALVSKFLNGQIPVLEPAYSPMEGYHYPIVEEILEDKTKVPQFLEKLTDLGILEKKIFDKTLLAPNAGPNTSLSGTAAHSASHLTSKKAA